MATPVVFISRFRIKEGKLEDFKRLFPQGAEGIKSEKPGTYAFLGFLNEAGTEAAIVHVFPDAAAMDRHVEGAEERAKASFEFIEPAGVEIYGPTSEGTSEMFRRVSGSGLPLTLLSQSLGGFLRA